MPLLSIEFTLFLLLFFPLYWSLKFSPNLQNSLLLITGLAWLIYLNPLFAAVVSLFAFVITLFATLISQTQNQTKRQRLFIIGIFISLTHLAFFKYFDFFREEIKAALPNFSLDILLPIGISYYTFQAIAYLHTCYTKKIPPFEWHDLLLHFSFFFTITSGPIIRADKFKTIYGEQLGFIDQLHSKKEIISPILALGYILLGVLKIWWWAGWLTETYINPIFDNPAQYHAFAILTAIYAYTFQLFLNFSGYTDMVVGLAMLFGFRLPHNFFMPLAAYNLRDFWNRWHITLSSWIRDYIYIPLGGNRKGFFLTQLYLIIAMVLSGIWHGYSLNFAIWGLLHALGLVGLNLIDKIFKQCNFFSQYKLGKFMGILITFNFVSFTFLIFKLENIDDIWVILNNLKNFDHSAILPLPQNLLFMTILIGYIFLSKQCYPFIVNIAQKGHPFYWILPIILTLFLVIIFSPAGIPGFIYANF